MNYIGTRWAKVASLILHGCYIKLWDQTLI